MTTTQAKPCRSQATHGGYCVREAGHTGTHRDIDYRSWDRPNGTTDLTASILKASNQLATERGQAIEAYIRVYLETTGTSMNDIELVEQRHPEREGMIVTSWYCRTRRQ